MVLKVAGWFGLISVICIGLFGLGIYVSLLTFLISFLIGIFTILFITYDDKKIFSVDIDCLDDPLQKINFSIQLPKVVNLFKKEPVPSKFDHRITGSETVDVFLNEIVTIIVNDYVNSWYELVTDDEELTTQSIKKLVIAAGANVANRIKSVDWISLLSTKFPDELTTHLKLFKQSRVRLKHIHLLSAKDVTNGTNRQSPKRQDDKKTHRRNKSDTDLSWLPDSSSIGNSKFYNNNENCSRKSLKDLFFDLECSVEKKEICRDVFCTDPDKEYAFLSEISEAVLYLVAPEGAWECHASKLILIELLSSIVLGPIISQLSDPDNINRAIIRLCCRDISLSSELFLLVVRSSGDAEELDATLELVQKDIQKLHSKDSAGEWEIQDRQKLSSLQYLTRIIQARRATVDPIEGLSTPANQEKVSEEVTRSLKFLSETTAWRSNAQYSLEIEMSEIDSTNSSKSVIDKLRSSALELCDMYLSPNRPGLIGLPENCYSELVRKITTEDDEFDNNPVACFDELQKCIYEVLEDDPSWQSDFMMDAEQEDNLDKPRSDPKRDEKLDAKKYSEKCKKIMKNCFHRLPKLFQKSKLKLEMPKSSTFPRSFAKKSASNNKSHTLPKCKTCGDALPPPGLPRHSRSRSDVGGHLARIIREAGPSNLTSLNSINLSLSHSNINSKGMMFPLSACIIETALVQEKGRAFGIYAIAVTRLSDNEIWHIYRRYSDFYDLHCCVKDKWPELSQLPFPAKKTFQNTSRSVLESRKRLLNDYLQSLASLSGEPRYAPLLAHDFLGGFLSPENQAEKHSSTIDALLVNSLRAGMRTLKNMPDQLANTVDGVMGGISKVFQGKGENHYEGLKSGNAAEGQDFGVESASLRLLEEALGLRGLWLRRRLLAPIRTFIGERVHRKVFEFVSSLTSPRNVVSYLKTFKNWLTSRGSTNYSARDSATKARTRVAAKVALLAACSDDLRHIVGTDTARRGLLTVFDLFQTQELNRRLLMVLLESIVTNLFPENNMQELFKRLYSTSPRVPAAKKSGKI